MKQFEQSADDKKVQPVAKRDSIGNQSNYHSLYANQVSMLIALAQGQI